MFDCIDIQAHIEEETQSVYAQGATPDENTDWDSVEFNAGCEVHEEAGDWQGMLAGDTVGDRDDEDVSNVDFAEHFPMYRNRNRLSATSFVDRFVMFEGQPCPRFHAVVETERKGDDVFPDFVDEEFEGLCSNLESIRACRQAITSAKERLVDAVDDEMTQPPSYSFV